MLKADGIGSGASGRGRRCSAGYAGAELLVDRTSLPIAAALRARASRTSFRPFWLLPTGTLIMPATVCAARVIGNPRGCGCGGVICIFIGVIIL